MTPGIPVRSYLHMEEEPVNRFSSSTTASRPQTLRGLALLLLSLLTIVLLAACGGAPAAEPTAAPAAPAGQPAAALEGLDDALLAQGQILFEKDAGGVGCASCHGMDARGNESIGAPDIQGRTEAQIRSALSGVDMMTVVKVKPDEIEALSAYLQHLSTQP